MPNYQKITAKLFHNWLQLLQNFDINKAAAGTTFSQIVESYSHPNRYYHNLEHIYHVLEVTQTLKCQTEYCDIKTVQLAGWFHDIVYDTKAKDNEEKSAEYAVKLLSSLSIPSNVIENVKKLILATKNHQMLNYDINAQILLDADLAILGSNPDEYNRYARAIRQEYIWVPELEYRAARKQILQHFLQRRNIYFTQIMQQVKETSARNNLNTEIELELKVKG
ncbi:MAG: HD domain-containing protein [Rivularia sp. (in: Bacteria)]|nr:HD domain-containing protein [Rivularia sp. MS3]